MAKRKEKPAGDRDPQRKKPAGDAFLTGHGRSLTEHLVDGPDEAEDTDEDGPAR